MTLRAIAFTIILLIASLPLRACQTAPPYAAAPPEHEEGIELNHGYALLYSTIVSETDLAQVLMIKNPRTEVAALLKDITEFAKDARDSLAAAAADDPALGFATHGLPHAEARTRDLITQTTSRRVMMTGGRQFEYTILLTQHEALTYIIHLAEALREMDENEDRRAYLAELRTDAMILHQRVDALLRTGYVGDAGEE